MRSAIDKSAKTHGQKTLSMDRDVRELLSDISLNLLAQGAGMLANHFVQAAGEALGADMLFLSRIKSKNHPVETYSFYDLDGALDHYNYDLAGTPCETVFDTGCPLAICKKVAACFPADTDLVELGLHSYAGVPLFDEEGVCVGLIVALWKNERDSLDRELKALTHFAPAVATSMLQLETEARTDLALAGSTSGLWHVDFEADMEYLSASARRIMGLSSLHAKAKRGTGFSAVFSEDYHVLEEAFRKYLRGEQPFDVSLRVQTDDGSLRWLRMTGKSQRNAKGRVIAMAGDVMDISELVEARHNAEAASQAKSEFLATVSHEIRTPMNGVLGMAGALVDSDIPLESKRQAQVIKKSGEAMMVILNDLLDLSKIEVGKLELEDRAFDPVEMLNEVAMLWRTTIENKNITFNIETVGDLPALVRGDDARLRQVISNLLSNALKFTPAGGITIRLEAKQDADTPQLRFSVTDTGIGIEKAQQEKLFSAFGQANSSISRRFGGTGLGLSISEKIVKLMDGEFTVTSEPGKGSTFSFTITAAPIGRDIVGNDAPAILPAPTKTELKKKLVEAAVQNWQSILIVDDIKINRTVLKALLGSSSAELAEAENGEQAVELANAQKFDLILMDVQMPVLDGIIATRMIRDGDGASRDVPIIALTANAMPGDRQQYLDAGMNGYVSKPIDPKSLFKALLEVDKPAKNPETGISETDSGTSRVEAI